ncbi:hypothetical protein Sbal625DRAFT_1289 [Shewanella baltica OS625]|uniref:hypothetical protein n=1 Tax=Shewanella TaxID=22 RepID=UPI0001DB828C|nr:hypothetical protein [Shewanella baltica]ADT93397.1 hypothetical protein Sbal678_1219 [Shewanella baltica OS678]EHC06619.1 hypothetical protein Sbal625DRAFT_1289 [Shewanella baltica OS625]
MDKSIKVGIITGIVASMVFVYFLDPIIRIFGEGVFYASNYVVSGLVDSLYQKSALGVAKDPSLTVYALIIGFITAFPVAMIRIFFQKKSNDDKSRENSKRSGIMLIPIAILPLMLFYQMWTMMFQYEVVTSFDQHIKIVTPYISEKEKQIIVSKFSMMNGESDFKSLYAELDKIASENKLVLPKNKTYGLWAF